ncbi:DUF2071 domain-containing protein [Actinoplanes sp. CA-131856]
MRDVSLEPVTPVTPRPVRRAVLRQRWMSVAFLHWPLAPELAAPFLPVGTAPDTFDGLTYVGLIGFRMKGTHTGICRTSIRSGRCTRPRSCR